MSKWKCVCCGGNDPCFLDTGSAQGKPKGCPIDADYPDWEPVKDEQHGEPVTECNQWPKLTVEVFDRPDCPEWAKWAAVSANGFCYFFENEPSYGVGNFKGQWYVDTGKTCLSSPLAVFNASDWQNSLIERPAKLPEWCKVGAWVWVKSASSYERIEDLEDGKIVCNTIFFEVAAIGKTVFQARLRQYTADEMRELVGKILEHSDGSRNLITDYNIEEHGRVYVNYGYQTAEDLIIHGYTLDGNPCGVLEHLENGEWKE